MEMIARFDRSPEEQVQISLVTRGQRTYVEFRVVPKSLTAVKDAGPEVFSLPADLLEELEVALEAVRQVLHPAEDLARGEMGTAITAPGPPPAKAGMPIVGRWGIQSGRTGARVPLECHLEYSVRGREMVGERPHRGRGRTIDISRHGLGVLLPERVSIFNVLHVDLHLPQGVLSLLGEVVWAQLSKSADPKGEGCRHGLRFTDLGPTERRLLDRLLDDLGG